MPGSGRSLRFELEWRITLFTALVLPLLVGLGFWQLTRAQEKAGLEASWEMRQTQRPAALSALWEQSTEALAYLPVEVTGVFLQDEYFLLDNRIHEGRFGYEVLGILRLDGDEGWALVNRGWLSGDPARLVKPAVPPVSGRAKLMGHVYVPPGTPYLLAEQQLAAGWPKLLQAVEMGKIVPAIERLGTGPVFPYSIRINSGEPGALTVDWQVINVSPDKHRAYAAQWFTMALVLLLFYIFRSSNLWQWLRRSASAGAGH